MPELAQNIDPCSTTESVAQRLVLVVDDSKLQRQILRLSLAEWGYQVAEAATGAEALQFGERQLPDLILSDWMMPELDGVAFCQRLKVLQGESFSYFILLTSKSEKQEIAQGLEAGADDFLTKPVSAPELRARLMAGERILKMQRELTKKNAQVEAAHRELKQLYQALDNDLVQARQLQQSLVKERARDFGCASISLLLQPSGHVGGDLVGFFEINDREVGIFAMDVSGHGISSALMGARFAGYFSPSLAENNIAVKVTRCGFGALSPEHVVQKLNTLALTEIQTDHYLTFFYAVANLETGEVRATQAGHPHPLVQRADGLVETVGNGGLPVGLFEGATYESFSMTLKTGDRLIIGSDGIEECAAPDGGFFGSERLENYLVSALEKKGHDVLDGLMNELNNFREWADFSDDISAILWEFNGRKASS